MDLISHLPAKHFLQRRLSPTPHGLPSVLIVSHSPLSHFAHASSNQVTPHDAPSLAGLQFPWLSHTLHALKSSAQGSPSSALAFMQFPFESHFLWQGFGSIITLHALPSLSGRQSPPLQLLQYVNGRFPLLSTPQGAPLLSSQLPLPSHFLHLWDSPSPQRLPFNPWVSQYPQAWHFAHASSYPLSESAQLCPVLSGRHKTCVPSSWQVMQLLWSGAHFFPGFPTQAVRPETWSYWHFQHLWSRVP